MRTFDPNGGAGGKWSEAGSITGGKPARIAWFPDVEPSPSRGFLDHIDGSTGGREADGTGAVTGRHMRAVETGKGSSMLTGREPARPTPASPRWTRLPVWTTGMGTDSVAEADTRGDCAVVVRELSADLTASLHEVAARLGVRPDSLLLAANAKVLASLSAEGETQVGVRASPPAGFAPVRVSVSAGSWAEVVKAVDRAADHSDAAPDGTPEVIVELVGPFSVPGGTPTHGGLPAGVLLEVGLSVRPGPGPDGEGEIAVLFLRHRLDSVDGDYADRLAAYHLAALRSLASDPDAPHTDCDLVPATELAYQLDDLAGPVRPLPDRRFTELFEQGVLQHPERIAAVHAGRRWTYRDLNEHANRLARALLTRGFGGSDQAGVAREDVVAVMTGRGLYWLATVIAVFKAGCVYLPIEPGVPADRVADMLTRSSCRGVLTDSESRVNLPLPSVSGQRLETLLIDDLLAAGHDHSDPGTAVAADQAAYVLFTSGSTGVPKGAVCEHAGMLNHLLAKVEDMALGEDDVVAQTASCGFDISLWQLLAGLLVGARTVIIDQDVVLDVAHCVGLLRDEGVTVAQFVPSYLEIVLSHLGSGSRGLGRLRCLSVTGEALKKELAVRWFARHPDVPLVNAYGLTETCDDTNHEILREPPQQARVPLGRPVRNVRILVTDDRLRPVPLGAVGEIVASGVCVGRGYIGDPELTRASFPPDPARPDARLYRTGDLGRWLPDGKLEFLGRRDSQVKLNGFRIELGEIENRLVRMPEIRDAAVVVAPGRHQESRLVAFLTASDPLTVSDIEKFVATALPAYMMPTSFHVLDTLPVTGNGKVDRKALVRLAESAVGSAAGSDARLVARSAADPVTRSSTGSAVESEGQGNPLPRTASESRLAEAWAAVLGLSPDEVGRSDHFFAVGGTSLSAVRLVLALDQALSLADVNQHPVLSDLAAVLAASSAHRPSAA